MYYISEILNIVVFLMLVQILFKEKLTISAQSITFVIGIYIVGILVLVLLGLENSIFIWETTVELITLFFVLNEKWYETFMSFLLLFSLPSLLNLCITIILQTLVGHSIFVGFLNLEYRFYGKIILAILLIPISIYRYKNKQRLYIGNINKIFLTSITFVFMFSLALLSKNTWASNIVTILMAICSILILVMCIWLIVVDSSRKMENEKSHMIEQYLNYILKIEEEQTEVRKIYHDIKRHINTINLYANEDNMAGIKKYISTLDMNLSEQSSYLYLSDNRIFNAILSEKMSRAKDSGIKICFKGVLKDSSVIEDFDLVIIVSNLIDNALEYAVDHGVNQIDVQSYQDDCKIIISVRNEIRNENIDYTITNKSDKYNHGFGLTNVRDSLRKYNGLLNIEIENQTFSATAIIYFDTCI